MIDDDNTAALMWAAWRELNAIRARDGAPSGVYEPYFSALVDAIENALGDDECKPWPSGRMKSTIAVLAQQSTP